MVNFKTIILLTYLNIMDKISPVSELAPKKVRQQRRKETLIALNIFDKKIKVHKVVEDIIDGKDGDIPIRIYYPSDAKNLPILLFFHGGGFVLMDMDTHDNVCRRLCNQGETIVISVEYRLAPEHKFPSAHNDSWEALNWASKHAKNIGGNANKISVGGDSAGGNLAASIAFRSRNENGPKINTQLLIYPWVDGTFSFDSLVRNGTGYLLTNKMIHWFRYQYVRDESDFKNPMLSPILETDFTNLAPALVMSCGFDPLVDENIEYVSKLKKGGNKTTYLHYPNQIHGCINVPFLSDEIEDAFIKMGSFLKEHNR